MSVFNIQPPPPILVVDDDTLTRLLVTEILNDHGLHAIPAACGQEALVIIDDLVEKPGLIISDMVMPGMNGFEMLQAVEDQHPSIKTLFITGSSLDAEQWSHADRADTALLVKPFRKSELLAQVTRMLDVSDRCSDLI